MLISPQCRLKTSTSISFPHLYNPQARIFLVHGQEFRHRRHLRFNLYWLIITNDGTFSLMIYTSTSKSCQWIYTVVFDLLLYKVIQLIQCWLYGALVLIKSSLNRPTSAAARTKGLHSLPLTLSISKTGENTSAMNGNDKWSTFRGNLLKSLWS